MNKSKEMAPNMEITNNNVRLTISAGALKGDLAAMKESGLLTGSSENGPSLETTKALMAKMEAMGGAEAFLASVADLDPGSFKADLEAARAAMARLPLAAA